MTLEEFFRDVPSVAVALSGGVDSAWLLHEAVRLCPRTIAYCVRSPFQHGGELPDAIRVAEKLGATLRILDADPLSVPEIVANPANRCYHCKKVILATILAAAREDGVAMVAEGSNASDDAGDRPGIRALRELQVRSPLRECGLTKTELRRLSREAGLFTWDKPAYACLATRIPTGEVITAEKLAAVEAAEQYLFSQGFTDFRVRTREGRAKLQLPADQMETLLRSRTAILGELKRYFSEVTLDLEARP